MKKGWIISIVSVILLILILSFGKNLFNPLKIHKEGFVTGTEDIEVSSEFSFTISPNDEFLLYFKEGTRETPDNVYGSVNIIETDTYKKHELDEKEGVIYSRINLAIDDDCWNEEGSLCVVDASNLDGMFYLIDFSDDEPKINEDTQISNPGIKTCSDCSENYFEEKYSQDSNWLKWEEGNKEYYSKGDEKKKASIYEKNLDSGKEREIITMNNLLRSHERIDELRISPNGKYLAFQITYGSGFVSPPVLYLLDIESGKSKKIKSEVYYDVHWSSDSKKLYYYSQKNQKGVYFVEVD